MSLEKEAEVPTQFEQVLLTMTPGGTITALTELDAIKG